MNHRPPGYEPDEIPLLYPAMLTLSNNKIFKGNISTIGMEFSPRYYANMFMTFLIKLFNSDWYEASFGLIKINYILYALVTTVIAIKFSKKID